MFFFSIKNLQAVIEGLCGREVYVTNVFCCDFSSCSESTEISHADFPQAGKQGFKHVHESPPPPPPLTICGNGVKTHTKSVSVLKGGYPTLFVDGQREKERGEGGEFYTICPYFSDCLNTEQNTLNNNCFTCFVFLTRSTLIWNPSTSCPSLQKRSNHTSSTRVQGGAEGIGIKTSQMLNWTDADLFCSRSHPSVKGEIPWVPEVSRSQRAGDETTGSGGLGVRRSPQPPMISAPAL